MVAVATRAILSVFRLKPYAPMRQREAACSCEIDQIPILQMKNEGLSKQFEVVLERID